MIFSEICPQKKQIAELWIAHFNFDFRVNGSLTLGVVNQSDSKLYKLGVQSKKIMKQIWFIIYNLNLETLQVSAIKGLHRKMFRKDLEKVICFAIRFTK